MKQKKDNKRTKFAVGVIIIITASAIFYFSFLGLQDKCSKTGAYEESHTDFFSPSDLIKIAAAKNETLNAVISRNHTSAGGIYNETGISYFYIKMIPSFEDNNDNYFENNNESFYYEIIIENQTLLSLNAIKKLPENIRRLHNTIKAVPYLVP